MLAATGSAVLVGRRLGGPILGAALMFSGALAVLTSDAGLAGTVALLALTGWRAVLRLDAGTPVPVVEIALLRSLPLFAKLPAPAIEGLAAALTLRQLRAGAVLIRQGSREMRTLRSRRVSLIRCKTGGFRGAVAVVKESGRSRCCEPFREPPP